MKISPLAKLLIALVVLTGWQTAALAQADKYKAGDKIEYRDYGGDVWEQGVYVGATPEGKQPIIRKKPNQFYPEGSQTASDWDRIRPLGAKPVAKAPAEAPAKGGDAPKAPTAPPTTTAKKPAETPAVLPAGGPGGLMTQEEVLGFLEARLGADPFGNPRRAEIRQELAEMVKRRGVNFRYETLSDFSNKMGKYGASSDVIFPLQYNFGPPTKQAWLMGQWPLGKIGATVDYKGNDGYIYRQGEIGVKNVGDLSITADGKYVWNVDVPRAVARGEWRKATAVEMSYQGGDGIVLLKAKGGVDWLVHQDRVTTLQGDWINVCQLGYRQIRENGYREPKK